MFKFIFLGFIQGLTEFLPLSSSGHLVILQRILDIKGEQLLNILVLHLATVLALIVFFFIEIIKAFKNLRLIFNILIVTLTTGLIVILGKEHFLRLFFSVKMLAPSFLITGIILILTKRVVKNDRKIKDINIKDALIMGIVQAVAVIPGISRSGITISTLLFRNIDKNSAFNFSFLASIPAIVGAFILEARELKLDFSLIDSGLLLGFIASFITGLLSLYILKVILSKAKFFYFGYYCILISFLSWFFLK